MKKLSSEAYKTLRTMEVIDSQTVKELVFQDYFNPNEISKPKIKKICIRDFESEKYPNGEVLPSGFDGQYFWTARVKKSNRVLIWKPFACEYYEVYNTNVKLLNRPMLEFDTDSILDFILGIQKVKRHYHIGDFMHIENTNKLRELTGCKENVSLRKSVNAHRYFVLTRTSMKSLYDTAFIRLRFYDDITGNSLSNEDIQYKTYDKMTVENDITYVDYSRLPKLNR